ncbi:MAG TPA: lysylphosphatidylglycerol synthase transmembrane domain-containing protein [Candidatus Pristimantibacillus sp.]|jgi:uncharacterized membrane protein YbhN (UPF0104 family)|nr:lysylphosphatidylglycerol synthase transmembrane domain-containing protein [Candidatus Pristimantibacillus sp.]
MKQRIKKILGPIIIGITVAAFAYYIKRHPETLNQLKQLPPAAIGLLLVLYAAGFLVYVFITRVQLRMYDKKLSAQENILFNAYSSLINFFGPGQSGPVFRGIYLKKRHGLGLKQFTFTTLLYLGCFAIISAIFAFIGSRPWWQTVLLVSCAAAFSVGLIRYYKKRTHVETGGVLSPANLGWLFGAVVLQVLCIAVIYGIELHQAGASPSVGQILSYTGVANFSLFVALTPGAIGIREAFLVFSQQLHHIDSSVIVAANIIDRAVYLLFLGILFVIIMSLHAREKLQIKPDNLRSVDP